VLDTLTIVVPLVTVVTPSFNQGRFIRATIESVLNQDYPRIEYLVMDGGSTDETVSILREYSGRIRWVSEPDRGQAHAINKGWRQSSGSIVAYLNSDDVYLPGAIARGVAALDAHPEAAAVYGEGYHVDEAGVILERYPTEPFDADRLREACYICQPTVFLRRDCVERVGYLDESLRYCMDYDLWIRLARTGKVMRYTPHYFASTRLHADAKTLDQRRPAHAEILRVIYRHFGRVPSSLVFGYAHAVIGLENRDASIRDRLSMIGISLATFLRYNRSVPRAAWPVWWIWLRDSYREARASLP
jgi:glycosyltransferase involved in cell wall biosynthesis